MRLKSHPPPLQTNNKAPIKGLSFFQAGEPNARSCETDLGQELNSVLPVT